MAESDTTDPTDPTEQSRWRPLRLLLDAMDADIARVYAEAQIDELKPSFVLELLRLHARGPMTITELAASVDRTGLLRRRQPDDPRRRDVPGLADDGEYGVDRRRRPGPGGPGHRVRPLRRVDRRSGRPAHVLPGHHHRPGRLFPPAHAPGLR